MMRKRTILMGLLGFVIFLHVFACVALAESHHGFQTIGHFQDEEAEYFLMRHEKTGAELLYIDREDVEKTFSIGFRTLATDNSGVNHIIEHALLNGSQNYPVKSPFVHMMNHSAATFINALTFSDFTMYLVASKNEVDFYNLMRVYLDAVFFPLVLENEMIFKQEGVRYEGDGVHSGTVYNEMKGAYSLPERYVDTLNRKSIFPDTQYQYDSGGYPTAIETLTYESFLETYRKNYTPSNALFVLCGKQNIDRSLRLIHEEYLAHFEESTVDTSMPKQMPFAEARRYLETYPVTEAGENRKRYLSLNYALAETADVVESFKVTAAISLLLMNDGSPLKKTLLDLGVANHVTVEIDEYMSQSMLSIVMEGAGMEDREIIEQSIQETLLDIVENGIDESALKVMKNIYAVSEIAAKNSPNSGVNDAIAAMRSFVYGQNALQYFEDLPSTADILDTITQDCIKQIIQTYLLDNVHRSIVEVTGESVEQLEKETTRPVDIDEFMNWQQTVNTAEELATLPKLTLDALQDEPTKPKYVAETLHDTPYIWTNVNRNGLFDVTLSYDASAVLQDKLPYLALFAQLLGEYADTEHHHYGEVQMMKQMYLSDYQSSVKAFETFGQIQDYKPIFNVSVSGLEKNADHLIWFLKEITAHTRFTNKEAVKLYLDTAKSFYENNAVTLFPRYAALANLSEKYAYEEAIAGYSYYQFILHLRERLDQDWIEIANELQMIKELLFNESNLIVSVTGSDKMYEKIQSDLDWERGQTKREAQIYHFEPNTKTGFASQTSRINSVFQAFDLKQLGRELKVLESMITYEYLWRIVRDQGGAYNTGAYIFDNGVMILVSNRDPHIEHTLEAYQGIGDFLRNTQKSEEEWQSMIIKTVSDLDENFEPHRLIDYGLYEYLGITNFEEQMKIRSEMLKLQSEDFTYYADLFDRFIAQENYAVAGASKMIRENHQLFDRIKSI